jgi:hypothetical protein
MARAVRPLLLAVLAFAALAACQPPWRPPVTTGSGAPRVAVPPARLVVDDSRVQDGQIRGVVSRAVDPDTLADLPGLGDAELFPCGSPPAPSPDGRVLAVVTRRPDGAACNVGGRPELRLFDLDRWEWASGALLRADPIGRVVWSRDGSRLYVLAGSLMPEERRPDPPASPTTLWVVDPSGAAPPVASAHPFAVHRLDLAPDGAALYALAYELDPDEWRRTGGAFVSRDPALLVVLDPATGAERGRVPLPGVKLYQRAQRDAQGRPLDYPQYWPGVALSPDGRHYYVARADAPLLDVVDLTVGRVERTVRLEPTAVRGPIELLLDLLAGRAEAKGGRQYTRGLALSPDGRWLYASGDAADVGPPARPGATGQAPEPLGILRVDARDFSVRQLDPTAPGAQLSPDGRWLYVTDPPSSQRPGVPVDQWGKGGPRGARLRVLEAGTGREVARLFEDRELRQLAFHGRDRLYATLATADYHGDQPFRADERLVELVALETGSWRELGRRTGGYFLRVAMGPW